MQFLRRWLKIERPQSAAIRPHRKLELPDRYDRVFGLALEGIERVLGGAVREADLERGYIEATFGLTFSERLTCELKRIDDTTTRIDIESRRGVQAQARYTSDYVDALASFLMTSVPT